MFACSLFVGIVSVLPMVSCVLCVFMLEFFMLFIVLYNLDGLVLWLSVSTKLVQFFCCVSFIFVPICWFSSLS